MILLKTERNMVITSHQVLHRPEETECHLQCIAFFQEPYEIWNTKAHLQLLSFFLLVFLRIFVLPAVNVPVYLGLNNQYGFAFLWDPYFDQLLWTLFSCWKARITYYHIHLPLNRYRSRDTEYKIKASRQCRKDKQKLLICSRNIQCKMENFLSFPLLPALLASNFHWKM